MRPIPVDARGAQRRFCRIIANGVLISPLLIGLHRAKSEDALQPVAEIEFEGDVVEPEQLSGIARDNDFVVVVPDEGTEINVLTPSGEDRLAVHATPSLPADGEIDMEGAASDGKFLYVIGSHSVRRKEVEADRTYRKNRDRLLDLGPHEDSYRLYRIKLDSDGQVESEDQLSLQETLEGDEILKLFCPIPSKENGVDIEGIAVRDGKVYLGFRGPVLRGNYVPVLSFEFEEPDDYELSFVELDGRGVRDLAATEDGFLILAGPVGDGDGTYQLHWWNGEDCIPGDGAPEGETKLLGKIDAAGGKPEGVAVVSEDSDRWEILLAADGRKAASKYAVPKP